MHTEEEAACKALVHPHLEYASPIRHTYNNESPADQVKIKFREPHSGRPACDGEIRSALRHVPSYKLTMSASVSRELKHGATSRKSTQNRKRVIYQAYKVVWNNYALPLVRIFFRYAYLF